MTEAEGWVMGSPVLTAALWCPVETTESNTATGTVSSGRSSTLCVRDGEMMRRRGNRGRRWEDTLYLCR